MTARERVHQLVDQLPETDMEAIERVLNDPLLRALLDARDVDPPLTPDEIAGIMEAKREVAVGQVHSFTDVEDAIRWLHNGPEPETGSLRAAVAGCYPQVRGAP